MSAIHRVHSRGMTMVSSGLWWVYGPGGLFSAHLRAYLRYFRPGFHPWQVTQAPWYGLWRETFNRTGDPIEAGRAGGAASRRAK